MERDFIANLLYYLFSEDKKENPMPPDKAVHLFRKIRVILKSGNTTKHAQKEGE